MALQGSGPIRFSQIANEFGLPPNKNLNSYRVSKSIGNLTLNLDEGIPGPNNPIKFSNFYNKRLNIVVNYYASSVNNTTRKNARTDYDKKNIIIITPTGVTKTDPPIGGKGSKIWIHVNQTIGSEKLGISKVALKTGSWDNTAQLITHIGPSGRLLGAGGDGGAGRTGNGTAGTQGTSGLGIQYSTTIVNQGLIFGGRGGGGGGGGGVAKRCSRNQRGCKDGSLVYVAGGGGAGGRGLPAGSGGSGGNKGTDGTTEENGSPGNGSSISGTKAGFDGFSGVGGTVEQPGGNGNNGSGGGGGSRGYAIVVNPGASIIGPITGSGTVSGDTVSETVS